jgi:AAA15 family ATPase/GTPase
MIDDTRWDEKMDLTQYGEGVQRIYFISLLFASARNGIVLIDELENAIHTTLLTEFARFIDQLSHKFNTQVFITSHSKECIDAIVRNMQDPQQLVVTSLIESKDRIVSKQYDGPKYLKLLNAGDVDIRRAYL